MKHFSAIPLAFVLFFALAAVSAGRASERRALLIGINDYASPSLLKLRGALNDMELVAEVLKKQFDFPAANLTILRDEQASREAILAAIQQLVAESGPNDFLYIHFSGHGAQVEDFDGDEEDGMDETLVAQDSRTEGVPDILDDEISALIEPLASRAVMVVDACHSGTITRGEISVAQLEGQAVIPRSAPPDPRLDLYRDRSVAKRGIGTPALEERLVLMTGAAEYQAALDGPVDGKVYGFFTYAFSKSLQRAGTGAPPFAILEGVKREFERIRAMHGRTSMPEPQLVGRESQIHQPLIPAPRDGATVARVAWAEVEPAEGGGLLLRGGGSLSASPGSNWAIYPPGETEFAAGGAVAVVQVTSLRGADAVVELREGADIQASARAIPAMAARPPQEIPVSLREMTEPARAALQEALHAQSAPVSFVPRHAFARYIVDREGDEWVVYSSTGLEEVGRYPGDVAEASRRLSALLQRSAKVAELLAIDNDASQMALGLRVSGERNRGIRVVKNLAHAQADLAPRRLRFHVDDEDRSSQNSLQLDVTTSRDCYLTLIDVDSTGGLTLLFPNKLSEAKGFIPQGKIAAARPVSIPDSLAEGNRAGFYLDYSPPAGSDSIRGFCHTHPEDAKVVREMARASAAMETRSRGAGDPTERVRIALRGITISAGEVPEPAPTQSVAQAPEALQPPARPARDWATASLNLIVGP